ncbi:MAG: ATP-binding cassette domain-containing protein, partial [Bdellovibrionales bacterium]|nr:ATP-binding cassette domain-containing protein [Bdellovibrionales bacterium]
MRCKLLHLLGEDPDILLLDEPTNYLDLESVLILEHYLQDFQGAFLLISHDREFLRRTTDHILEVEDGNIVKFNGGLDDYFEQKQMLQEQLQAKAMNLAEKRKQILDFVNRFGAKATKAKQAQSRLKTLNKMETIEIKSLPTTAKIKIPSPTRTGKKILSLEDVDLGYDNNLVLKNIKMDVWRGDHIGVVGVNGAGKSTLLKALAGRLEPKRGYLEHGINVEIGFYAQHVTEALEPEDTVIEALKRKAHEDIVPENVLNIAGSLLFQGEDIHKKIKVLSGGEKSRVALGQILLQKAPCLILDEPTNHLDFQTVEALTMALNEYEGTVIIVSHDRSFVQRVSQKIIKIEDGAAELFPGDYNEYVWSLQKGMLASYNKKSKDKKSTDNEVRVLKGGNKSKNFKDLKKEIKDLEKEQKKLERTIAELDQKTLDLSQKLAQQNDTAEEVTIELSNLQSQKDECENKWLEIVELVESKREQL